MHWKYEIAMRVLHSDQTSSRMRPLSLKDPFLSACAHNVLSEVRGLLSRGAEVRVQHCSTAGITDPECSTLIGRDPE